MEANQIINSVNSIYEICERLAASKGKLKTLKKIEDVNMG